MLETYEQELKKIDKKIDVGDFTGAVSECGKLVEGLMKRIFHTFHKHLDGVDQRRRFFEWEKEKIENPPPGGISYQKFLAVPTTGVAMRFYPPLCDIFPKHPYTADKAIAKSLSIVNSLRNSASHVSERDLTVNDASAAYNATRQVIETLGLMTEPTEESIIPLYMFIIRTAIENRIKEKAFSQAAHDACKLLQGLMEIAVEQQYPHMSVDEKLTYLTMLEEFGRKLNIRQTWKIYNAVGVSKTLNVEVHESSIEPDVTNVGMRVASEIYNTVSNLMDSIDPRFTASGRFSGVLAFIEDAAFYYFNDYKIDDREKNDLCRRAPRLNIDPAAANKLIDDVVEAIQQHIAIYQTIVEKKIPQSEGGGDAEGVLIKMTKIGSSLDLVKTMAAQINYEGDVDALYQKYGVENIEKEKRKKEEIEKKIESELIDLILARTPLVAIRKIANHRGYAGDVESLFELHKPQEYQEEEVFLSETPAATRKVEERESDYLDALRIAMQVGEISPKMREMLQIKQLELGISFKRGQELETAFRKEQQRDLEKDRASVQAIQSSDCGEETLEEEATEEDLPSPQYLMPYVISELNTAGGSVQMDELVSRLADSLELDPDLLTLEQSGKPGVNAFSYRVEWACDALIQDGRIHRDAEGYLNAGAEPPATNADRSKDIPSPMQLKDLVVSVLGQTGQTMSSDELRDSIADELGLSDSARRLKRDESDVPVFQERLSWACRALKEDGAAFNPEQGKWSLVKIETGPSVAQAGMELLLTPETTIAELIDMAWEKLNINLRVYRAVSRRGRMAQREDNLGIVANLDVRPIFVDPVRRVDEVERQFADQLGLGVRIMNPDGEGFADEDVTLQELAEPTFATSKRALMSIEINGANVSARTVKEFYLEVVAHLFEQGVDLSAASPLSIGRKYYLLSSDGLHPTGKPFENPSKVGSVFIDVSPATREKCLKNVQKLLEALKIPWKEADQESVLAEDRGCMPVSAARSDPAVEDIRRDNGGNVALNRPRDFAFLDGVCEVIAYRKAEFEIELGERMLHAVPVEELAAWVQKVVNVEAPIHMSVLEWRICELAGIGRAGIRVTRAIGAAADQAIHQGWVWRNGDFLMPTNGVVKGRNRELLDNRERDFHFVSPEEYGAVLLHQLRDDGPLLRAQAIRQVYRVLGYGRVSSDMEQHLESVVNDLLAREFLAEGSDGLSCLKLALPGEPVGPTNSTSPVGLDTAPTLSQYPQDRIPAVEAGLDSTASSEDSSFGSSDELEFEPYEKAAPELGLAGRMLHTVPMEELAGWVRQVADFEAPIHIRALEWRICELSEIKRAGHRVTAAIGEAADFAASQGWVVRRGDFVLRVDGNVKVRNRADLEVRERDFALISPEEYAMARSLLDVQLPQAQAIRQIYRAMGFGRVSADMEQHLEVVLNQRDY